MDINGKQIFELLEKGQTPPRVPFSPTIFEHAAKVIGVSPSRLAQNVDLLVSGQLAAYEQYHHDLVSVAVDVYNVEAEALGCRIIYREDNTIPSLAGPIVNDADDLKNLTVPDPYKDGRMPLFIEACEILKSRIGDEVFVSGNVVGPFTLAAIIRGFENLIIDLVMNEDFAEKLLDFTSEVGIAYASGFIRKGIRVAISESWIAPPLLSPELYRSKVFPVQKRFIERLKQQGLKKVALISGGNTYLIAKDLVRTGTALLVADANTSQKEYKRLCRKHGINLRANIDSKMVEAGDVDAMEKKVKDIITNCAEGGRFIFGCGVVSYQTPPENIRALKRIVEKHNPYHR